MIQWPYVDRVQLPHTFTGKRLTHAARLLCGIERKRWLWIFKESDRSLRKRCVAILKAGA